MGSGPPNGMRAREVSSTTMACASASVSRTRAAVARREIALQHDTLQAGTDGLARRIGGVRAGLEDRQRDDAARGRTGYEFRRVGTEQQAIDGPAGKAGRAFGDSCRSTVRAPSRTAAQRKPATASRRGV